MTESQTQKVVERGVLQFLLNFYLKLMQRLVMYSLNLCVYMLNKVINIDIEFSVNRPTNKKSHEESIQKVNNCSNNWVNNCTMYLSVLCVFPNRGKYFSNERRKKELRLLIQGILDTTATKLRFSVKQQCSLINKESL